MIGSLGCPADCMECWLVNESVGLNLKKESLRGGV